MATLTLPEVFFSTEVQSIGWTDIHTHLNFLEISPEEAVEKAKAMGVHRMITIGTEPPDLPVVQDLARRFAPEVFCTLGIHPHEGQIYDDSVEDYLLNHLAGDRVVAVGEIGLDYYYNHSNPVQQQEAFRRQMDLAAKFNLPVEIHTRDAEADTIEVLKEYRGKVQGVIHCFTGTQILADAALDCGYDLSFSGVVTFKNAHDLRAVCLRTPLDRLHVETDAPFLAPTPLRGQKNQPDFVLWTAHFVSQLKQTEVLAFCEQMKFNAERVFTKLKLQ